MKNILLFIFIILGVTLFAQNNSTHFVVKVGQSNFSVPEWPAGEYDIKFSNQFGIGLENVHQSKKRPNIGFSWGFIPTYQKLIEYREQTHEANNPDGSTTLFVNYFETKYRFIDLAIPLKIMSKIKGFEISAGLTPVYHANTRIKGYQTNYDVALPDQKWENETTSHLCHTWLRDCSFETVSWEYPLDFWGSIDLGYRFNNYKISVHYDQNLTRGQLQFGGGDFALIDVSTSLIGFWGNANINTQNISLQMSYQLF